ncbi:MAG: winged helix-turn-helix transcriptional regulator [Nocardioides sp.]|nr:winged helix-turn-helix transcriptional regulator [Nocardioides sp.]
MLTDREQQIVNLLRRDPLMGSAALAQALGTTRAAINVHLSNLGKKGVILGRGYVLSESPGAVVVGGANVDLKARSAARATPATSNPGHASMTPGGVGRNIAENLARLGDRVDLVSIVGRDALGDNLLEHTAAAGVRIEHVARTDQPTGTYTAVLDMDGELLVAIADMEATAELGPQQLHAARDVIAPAGVLVLDGNLSREAFDHALDLGRGVRSVFEPVSVPKAALLKEAVDGRLHAVTPNRDELAALTDLPTRTDRQVRVAARALHDRGVELVWIRLGARGSLLSSVDDVLEIEALPATVDDVTGAGDAMLAAFCHVLLAGGSAQDAARFGHAAAALTIASPHTVRPDLTPRLLQATLEARPDQETDR